MFKEIIAAAKPLCEGLNEGHRKGTILVLAPKRSVKTFFKEALNMDITDEQLKNKPVTMCRCQVDDVYYHFQVVADNDEHWGNNDDTSDHYELFQRYNY